MAIATAAARLLGEEDISLILEALRASSQDPSQAPSPEEVLRDIRGGRRLYTCSGGLVLGGVVASPAFWVDAFRGPVGGYRALRSNLDRAIRLLVPVLAASGVEVVSAPISASHPHREAILRIHGALGLKPHVLITACPLRDLAAQHREKSGQIPRPKGSGLVPGRNGKQHDRHDRLSDSGPPEGKDQPTR